MVEPSSVPTPQHPAKGQGGASVFISSLSSAELCLLEVFL